MKGGDILDFQRGGDPRKGEVDLEGRGVTPFTNYDFISSMREIYDEDWWTVPRTLYLIEIGHVYPPPFKGYRNDTLAWKELFLR